MTDASALEIVTVRIYGLGKEEPELLDHSWYPSSFLS